MAILALGYAVFSVWKRQCDILFQSLQIKQIHQASCFSFVAIIKSIIPIWEQIPFPTSEDQSKLQWRQERGH